MFFLDGGSGCGDVLSAQTTNFIGSLVKVIKTLVPIILIIMGSLEFAKATVAQNDDGLKKAKTNFIQKLIAGVAVFFVITFVSWLLGFLGESFGNKALECVSQFLGGSYTPGDIGDGSGNGSDGPTETYEECIQKCDENASGNGTAHSACVTDCNNKYDTVDSVKECMSRNNCTKIEDCTYCDPNYKEPTGTEKCVKDCIDGYNNGTYNPKFVNRGEIFASCKKSFDYPWEDEKHDYKGGAYGNACSNLEDCVSDSDSCEDITETQAQNCKAQYQEYKKYEKMYGSYTTNEVDIEAKCNNYADNYLKNNISEICKGECGA